MSLRHGEARDPLAPWGMGLVELLNWVFLVVACEGVILLVWLRMRGGRLQGLVAWVATYLGGIHRCSIRQVETSAEAGRRRVNRHPPSTLTTCADPPCARATPVTIASPRPDPRPPPGLRAQVPR